MHINLNNDNKKLSCHTIFQNETTSSTDSSTVSSCCTKIKNVLISIWEFIKKIFCCSSAEEEVDDRSEACSICFCKIENAAQLPCGHIFDFECIEGWLKADKSDRCCPLDKKGPYQVEQITKISA